MNWWNCTSESGYRLISRVSVSVSELWRNWAENGACSDDGHLLWFDNSQIGQTVANAKVMIVRLSCGLEVLWRITSHHKMTDQVVLFWRWGVQVAWIPYLIYHRFFIPTFWLYSKIVFKYYYPYSSQVPNHSNQASNGVQFVSCHPTQPVKWSLIIMVSNRVSR